jgi:predicted CxxxxCH...CXXCH cytochrome family protein
VDALKNVTFAGAVNASAAYDTGTKACSSVYCHSDGNDSGALVYNTADWDGSDISDCKGCHGGGSTYGNPAYQNQGANQDRSNSHAQHIAAAADCGNCHVGTTHTGTEIVQGSTTHLNTIQDVVINSSYDDNGGTSNWTAGTKTCNNVTCHGTGTPQWGGASLACSGCHASTGADSDNFYWGGGSGTAANIKTTGEWDTTGHGRPSGSGDYANYGNPAADFEALAGSGDACRWCHDNGVAHGNGTNPFRLKGYDSPSGTAWNGACLICHDTQSTGNYDGGEGFTNINRDNVVKVDKNHQMQAHTDSGVNGGKFCWDCHDPHGDSNLVMIHDKVAKETDGTYGDPGGDLANLVGNPVVFTDNSVATGSTGYAMTSGSYTAGVCNVCHTYSDTSPKMKYYTSGSSTNDHNTSTLCTDCHVHSEDDVYDGGAFQGGGCDGCHEYPPFVGDGKPTYSVEGKGKHETHVHHLELMTGLTMDPNADNFGDSKFNLVCGVCHDGATHETTNPTTTNREIVINSTTYMLGTTGSATFDGQPGTPGSTDAKTCSNISCHYKTTPEWQTYWP